MSLTIRPPSPTHLSPPIPVSIPPSPSNSSATTVIPFPYHIYTVHEVLLDPINFPTAVTHLRGVFSYLDDAVDTAWNRIRRDRPGRDWAVPPAQIYMRGKELYVVAVEADGCLLAVWVEGRVVRKREMEWVDIEGEGKGKGLVQ